MFTNQANSQSADPNSGQTLNRAAELCKPVLFDLLLQKGAQRETAALLHAVARSQCGDEQRASMMEHLLDLGFGINEPDDNQGPYARGTPMYHAIRAKNGGIIKFLIEKGADPKAENYWRVSAVEEVKKAKNAALVYLFPPEILG